MKPLDRLLQRWRIDRAKKFIAPRDRVLDLGCADGALFDRLPGIESGVGLDPLLDEAVEKERVTLLPGTLGDQGFEDESFDVVTMLAVLEHIPRDEQASIARETARILTSRGRLIITVPSPLVDKILAVLIALRLVEGMSHEQHYGFQPADTPDIFVPAGFKLLHRGTFQLGLNKLFVFEKEG